MEIKRKKFLKVLQKKGYSRYSLGRALGLSKAHVYQWCYGKQNPTVEHLIKLKDLLGVSGDEILEMFAERGKENERA